MMDATRTQEEKPPEVPLTPTVEALRACARSATDRASAVMIASPGSPHAQQTARGWMNVGSTLTMLAQVHDTEPKSKHTPAAIACAWYLLGRYVNWTPPADLDENVHERLYNSITAGHPEILKLPLELLPSDLVLEASFFVADSFHRVRRYLELLPRIELDQQTGAVMKVPAGGGLSVVISMPEAERLSAMAETWATLAEILATDMWVVIASGLGARKIQPKVEEEGGPDEEDPGAAEVSS